MDILYKKAAERMQMFIEVKRGTITLKEASAELSISYRHAKRLYKKFKTEGLWSLSPKKREGAPWNKTKEEVKEKVIRYKREYHELNLSHIADLLKEEGISISRETVRRILLKERLHSKYRKYRKRPRKRFEAEKAGSLLQMDSSLHIWIPGLGKMVLIGVIDDYSRKILGAKVVEHDTVWENMCVLREVVERYGIFEALYTDNDSKFRYIRGDKSRFFTYRKEPDEVETQISQSLSMLGIRIINTHVDAPYQKGKIERLFGYLQDRVINEFKVREIKNLDEANTYLRKWVEKHNREHIHATTKMIPDERFKKNYCFRPLPPDVNLDDVFCLRVERTVKRDNTFSYNGETFQLLGRIDRANFGGARVELHVIPRKRIRVFFDGEFLQEFLYNGD